jgi:hypothetical protein
MTALHVKYAPVLRFNSDEQFFPMRLDDLLNYSALYVKDQEEPVVSEGSVTPRMLATMGKDDNFFVRTVIDGPILGKNIAAEWGEDVVELVYRWSANQQPTLSDALAAKAYRWFNPKTKPAVGKFWWNGLVQQATDGSLQTAVENTLPRLILPGIIQKSAAERYHANNDGDPDYAYYYREVRDGDFLCLQYWFFYAYNDWGNRFGGMNDHEGDWEGIALYFRIGRNGQPQEPPAYITYADHESCQTKTWDDPDITRYGNHVVGFVGAGSHATYPKQGTQPLLELFKLFDYATADGKTIGYHSWKHRINLDAVPWVGQYAGSWGTRYWLKTRHLRTALQVALGSMPVLSSLTVKVPDEIALPGVSAPLGPVGPHREQYAHPVLWAGIAALEKENR